MRLTMLSLVMFSLFISTVHAQTEAPAVAPPEIAVYENAQLVTEFGLSDQDILGYLRAAMLAFGSSAKGAQGEVGNIVKAVDLESLAEALSSLKYLRLLQFRLAEPTKPEKILDFYGTSAGEGWRRIIWDISNPNRAITILVRLGLNDVMAVAVMTEKPPKIEKEQEGTTAVVDDPKPLGQRLVVARTVGMVDLEKFAAWAGNAVNKFSQMEERKRKEREAAAKAEAAKKTAPKPTAPTQQKAPVKK